MHFFNSVKKSSKRQKSKQNLEIDSLSNQLLNTSISEPKPKKSRKKTTKIVEKTDDQPPVPTAKTIDSFFPKLKQIEQLKNDDKLNFSFDMNASGFGDETDDLDISFIVGNLVKKVPKLPDKVEKLGYKIVFSSNDNCGVEKSLDLLKEEIQNDLFSENRTNSLRDSVVNCPQTRQIALNLHEDPISHHSDISDNNCHESDTDIQISSFFEINSREETDLFEKTFDKNFLSDNSSNTTIEFEIGDLEVVKAQIEEEEIFEENNEKADEFEDSFEFYQTYVPLLERIKKNLNQN